MSLSGQPPALSGQPQPTEPPTLVVVDANSRHDDTPNGQAAYQLTARLADLEARNRELAGWLWEAELKLKRLPEFERAWRQWEELDREIEVMRQSRSWRYTEVFRRIGWLGRRLLSPLPPRSQP